jgi:hypothetical protein
MSSSTTPPKPLSLILKRGNDVMAVLSETKLYDPVKTFLERQGYTVKAEVGAADVVAIRGLEPPLIVELKTSFSLTLFHQCVTRQAITDDVYLAVPKQSGKRFQKALRDNKALARRLGLGVITVRLSDGQVEVHQDPGPYSPRKSKRKQKRLLREFDRLQGDPNMGGATRHGIVTGYRQDALRCAAYLAEAGPSKGSVVARAANVKMATRIMADNHYGWFERVQTGIYQLTDQGSEGLKHWAYSWEDTGAP